MGSEIGFCMRMRASTCPTCHADFTYPFTTGRPKTHCSAECRVAHKKALLPARIAALPLCGVEECDLPAKRRGANLCEKHYMRLHRRGTTEKKQYSYRYTNTRGYVRLLVRDHPLAHIGGCVLEHRAVMYDALGEGPHPCYWCGTVLDWQDISVDHLNEDKTDNRRTNLVLSCNDCNLMRGGILPFLARLTDKAVPTFICAALAFRATAEAARIASVPSQRNINSRRAIPQ